MKLQYSATAISVALLLALATTVNGNDGMPSRYLRTDPSRQLQFDEELPQSRQSRCWLPWVTCPADQCEDVSPLSANEFDLDQYIAKSWYIQKQQTNPYQSENDLFCVVATYNRRNDGFIQVLNSANTGGVNGQPQNPETSSFFGDLCAQQENAGSLKVAPCFLQPIFNVAAGPYWVLAVGENYDWAIVSGGEPTEVKETRNGRTFCTTKEGESFLDTNGSGLWLFTKEQFPSVQKIATMEAKLTEMGIFTGDLKTVAHDGCSYPDSLKK